jgi:GT2 family glycosyltransferase
MKVVSISCVRNEADVLEAFVRHNARWVDRMLILCHLCEDNSVEILSRLAEEGLPIELREDKEPFHVQAAVLTELAREAVAEHEPDWVLPLDADEFLVAHEGSDPRAVLATLPDNVVPRIPWRTYVPQAGDDAHEQNVLRRIQHRRDLPIGELPKVVVSGRLARKHGFELTLGSHELVNGSTGRYWPMFDDARLRLAHFPVRSAQQLRGKVLTGWVTRLADRTRTPDQTAHWGKLFEECAQEGALGAKRLEEIALHYSLPGDVKPSGRLVHEPVEVPFELRYPAQTVDPVRVLALTAARFAVEASAGQPRWRPAPRPATLRDRVRNRLARRRLGPVEDRSVRDAPAWESEPPTLSIVIPSRNRREVLLETLARLARQDVSDRFEVIVVDDGSSDGTSAALQSSDWPTFDLVPFHQDHRGQATARNLGVSRARGEVCLFLGDDMWPPQDLVRRHLRFHAAHPDREAALLGRAQWAPETLPTPFMRWLEGGIQFEFGAISDRQDVEPRFFYTANVSVKTELLRDVGGFDESLRDGEDIELGFRLQRAGMRLVYDPETFVDHFHPADLRSSLRRMQRIGRAGLTLAERVEGWPVPPRPGFRHRVKATILAVASLVFPARPVRQAAWRFLCHEAFRESYWNVTPLDRPLLIGSTLLRIAERDEAVALPESGDVRAAATAGAPR